MCCETDFTDIPRRGIYVARERRIRRANAGVFRPTYRATVCSEIRSRRYTISFDDLSALRRLPRKQRAQFEIDVDGSFLYWPEVDVHVGFHMVRGVARKTRTRYFARA